MNHTQSDHKKRMTKTKTATMIKDKYDLMIILDSFMCKSKKQ